MNLSEIILIGIGLSMDAFAVSLSCGLSMDKIKFRDIFKVAICFGGFQAMMPLIGWLAANNFSKYIEMFDSWIALILLGYIGIKMIYDGSKNCVDDCGDISKISTLLLLGIATSIDALMVGVTFVTSFVGYKILFPVSVIGLTTFFISAVGVYWGKKFGEVLGAKAEIAGGIILILIGLKIFFL